jgi:hypothetical protein
MMAGSPQTAKTGEMKAKATEAQLSFRAKAHKQLTRQHTISDYGQFQQHLSRRAHAEKRIRETKSLVEGTRAALNKLPPLSAPRLTQKGYEARLAKRAPLNKLLAGHERRLSRFKAVHAEHDRRLQAFADRERYRNNAEQ